MMHCWRFLYVGFNLLIYIHVQKICRNLFIGTFILCKKSSNIILKIVYTYRNMMKIHVHTDLSN